MTNRNRLAKRLAILFTGSVMQLSWIDSCSDMLVGWTTVIEPCGTILGNCTPGSFQANNAPIGDWCVDPACVVPGGCGNLGPPLGTIRDICP